MMALLGHLFGSLALAAGITVIVLAAGLPSWQALVRRQPTLPELLGPVFLLGLVPLTLLSAVLVPLRGLGPVTVRPCVTVLTLLGLAAARPAWAALLAGYPSRARLWIKGYGAAWAGFGLLALLQALLSAAPNTVWDAWTYHYGLVEHLRRAATLAPQGQVLYEYWHLNSVLLNALWFGLAGEWAANAFGVAQTASLGAIVYWGVSRQRLPFWGLAGALVAICLPAVLRQGAGGGSEILLGQAVLAAYLLYEAGYPAAAGAAAGFAWGVKQSAPLLLLPLALLACWDYLRDATQRRGVVGCALAVALLGTPWLARTWICTGNPFFPACPRLTRLPTAPDLSYMQGHVPPFPFRALRVLADHAAPARTLADGIPAWVMLLLLLGALAFWQRGRHERAARRLWGQAGAALALACVLVPVEVRYALPAYVLALIAAFRSLAAPSHSTGAQGSPIGAQHRIAVVAAALLSFTLALAILGSRLAGRWGVLSGGQDREGFLAARYPHRALLRAVRPRFRPGDALLVFDSLTYGNGLPTFDAEPRWPGPRVTDWVTGGPERLLENFRRLGIRWVLVAAQYVPAEAALAPAGTRPGRGPSTARQMRVARNLAALSPWLRPAGSLRGVALYEVLPAPAGAISGRASPVRAPRAGGGVELGPPPR